MQLCFQLLHPLKEHLYLASGTCPNLKNNHIPRGSMYTAIVELGPQNHNMDGLFGPNSIIVMYMDPLGSCCYSRTQKVGTWL